MTNERVCATGEEVSVKVLRSYVDHVQSKTCRLSGVIQAIAHLESQESCKEGQSALIFIAEDMIKEIDRDLDCVNLPEVGQ